MNLLTREQYATLIDEHHAAQKARLLSRYDKGNKTYGGAPDLDSRDWIVEQREESDDRLAYGLFEKERIRRIARKPRAALITLDELP